MSVFRSVGFALTDESRTRYGLKCPVPAEADASSLGIRQVFRRFYALSGQKYVYLNCYAPKTQKMWMFFAFDRSVGVMPENGENIKSRRSLKFPAYCARLSSVYSGDLEILAL